MVPAAWPPSEAALLSRHMFALPKIYTYYDMTLDVAKTQNSNKAFELFEISSSKTINLNML